MIKNTTLVINFNYHRNILINKFYLKTRTNEHPVRQYTECEISHNQIQSIENESFYLKNLIEKSADKPDHLARKQIDLGKNIAQVFYPPKLQFLILNQRSKHILLIISDNLLNIPFELAYIDNNFICNSFAIGRIVETKQVSSYVMRIKRDKNFLILTDTCENLPKAYEEGINLKNFLDQFSDKIDVDLRARKTPKQFIIKALSKYQILHFAGHSQYKKDDPEKSGWVFYDGIFNISDIHQAGINQQLPEIIFSNACESVQMKEWEVDENDDNMLHNLANYFLINGVHHFIGANMQLPDEIGAEFAKKFYKYLLENHSIGESIQHSRLELLEKKPENLFVYSYILYGDPAKQLFKNDDNKSFFQQRIKNFFSNKINLILFLLTILIITMFVFIFNQKSKESSLSVTHSSNIKNIKIVDAYYQFLPHFIHDQFIQYFKIEIKGPAISSMNLTFPANQNQYQLKPDKGFEGTVGYIYFTNNKEINSTNFSNQYQQYVNIPIKKMMKTFPVDSVQLNFSYLSDGEILEIDTLIGFIDKTEEKIYQQYKSDLNRKLGVDGNDLEPYYLECRYFFLANEPSHFEIKFSFDIAMDSIDYFAIQLPWDQKWYKAVNLYHTNYPVIGTGKIYPAISASITLSNDLNDREWNLEYKKYKIHQNDTIFGMIHGENNIYPIWNADTVNHYLPYKKIKLKIFQKNQKKALWKDEIEVKEVRCLKIYEQVK